jgi:hypothetical protein
MSSDGKTWRPDQDGETHRNPVLPVLRSRELVNWRIANHVVGRPRVGFEQLGTLSPLVRGEAPAEAHRYEPGVGRSAHRIRGRAFYRTFLCRPHYENLMSFRYEDPPDLVDSRIWLVNRDGSRAVHGGNTQASRHNPSFTPDKKPVLFASNSLARPALYLSELPP